MKPPWCLTIQGRQMNRTADLFGVCGVVVAVVMSILEWSWGQWFFVPFMVLLAIGHVWLLRFRHRHIRDQKRHWECMQRDIAAIHQMANGWDPPWPSN